MAFFFFFFNKEKRIGFKKLTKADLGLGSSHQTHIGLYEDVFTFLQDSDVVKSAMLVYNDYCEILDCSFDRIQNSDGTFRSPKIKIGADHKNSIVSKIREFAKECPNDNWYLIWSGLESEELIFWLIREGSEDFKLIDGLMPKVDKVYGDNDACYTKVLDIFTKKVNGVSLGVQKEIETASQIGDFKNKYKRSDVERAEKIFRDVGKKGEALVAEYLSMQKSKGLISSFVWENQSKESGLPYDFRINERNFIDVKSTNFDFEQPIYFSNQEVDFASKSDAFYSVYRVYELTKDNASLRICSHCNPYLNTLDEHIAHFVNEINSQKAMLQTLKVGIAPNTCFSDIQSPVQL